MKKIFTVILFLITSLLFSGDIVELTPFDNPIIFKGKNFEILGTGIDTLIGESVILEYAIKNTGQTIDSLEIEAVFIDMETGFPLYQINSFEMDVQPGIRIIRSNSFNLKEFAKVLENGKIKQELSVNIINF